MKAGTVPPEFREVLKLIAEAARRMKADGAAEPILLGGAAVEIYTQGRIVSRDFDLAVPDQKRLENELEKLGFIRTGAMRGLWHPGHKYGIEVVAGAPFDGNYQASRNMVLQTDSGPVILLSVEDLIADRVGQFDATPYGDQERLTQAIYLYTGARGLDRLYLDRRIREEAHGRTLEWFIKEVEKRIQADSEQEREP